MNTEERESWLKSRRQGIGGSDCAAVLGLSPYKSPYQVWLEKRGESDPQPDNEAMYWGRALEPVIRQRYADITGQVITVPKTIIKNPNREWLICTPDGLTKDKVIEIKTSRTPSGWGEQGTAEIPEHYLLQVQHNLIVTRLSTADVVALIGGSDFRVYEVPADKELQEMIIEREAEFWEMVKNGTPPEPTTFADIRKKYGSISKGYRIQATDVMCSAIERLKELKNMADEEETLKALIMGYMKENDTLVDGDAILATWKASSPAKRFDTKAFQTAHPDLYQQFLKEGEASRRFLIK